MRLNVRRVAVLQGGTFEDPRARKVWYRVRCACGQRNRFWRWSWYARGAARCKGCSEFILSPWQAMPLDVIDPSYFPAAWPLHREHPAFENGPRLPVEDCAAATAHAVFQWSEYLDMLAAWNADDGEVAR